MSSNIELKFYSRRHLLKDSKKLNQQIHLIGKIKTSIAPFLDNFILYSEEYIQNPISDYSSKKERVFKRVKPTHSVDDLINNEFRTRFQFDYPIVSLMSGTPIWRRKTGRAVSSSFNLVIPKESYRVFQSSTYDNLLLDGSNQIKTTFSDWTEEDRDTFFETYKETTESPTSTREVLVDIKQYWTFRLSMFEDLDTFNRPSVDIDTYGTLSDALDRCLRRIEKFV